MNSDTPLRTIGAVARLTGLTVRTLHHWDEIGLCRPARRSRAGYRLYGPAELARLHRILLARELGLPLAAIASWLEAEEGAQRALLRAQRARLVERVGRLSRTLAALDRALADGDWMMNDEQMREVFGDFDPRAHQAEGEQRWGDTKAWHTAQARTRGYDAARWVEIRAEQERIEAGFAALLARGADPTGAEAVAQAERHRAHIERWYYPCARAMHAQVAAGYTEDARFRAHYEERAAGLAAFVRAAVEANAG